MINEYPGYLEAVNLKTKIKHLKTLIEGINNKQPPPLSFKPNEDYAIQYDKTLNESQLKSVSIIDKPLLVIAGAGTGKTRIIVYKVAYLIENGFNPKNILLLTFTRKAAEEMMAKVKQLLENKYQDDVVGGTFHSFACKILRQYHKLINIPPNFTIQDTTDSANSPRFSQGLPLP